MALPTVEQVLADSRYLGGAITLGAVAFFNGARTNSLLTLFAVHFAGHFFIGPYLLNMSPRKA